MFAFLMTRREFKFIPQVLQMHAAKKAATQNSQHINASVWLGWKVLFYESSTDWVGVALFCIIMRAPCWHNWTCVGFIVCKRRHTHTHRTSVIIW